MFSFSAWVLAVLTAFALFTAYSAFRAPKLFGERLGFAISGADGLNEVRAQYGGVYPPLPPLGVLALLGKKSLPSARRVAPIAVGGVLVGPGLGRRPAGGLQTSPP